MIQRQMFGSSIAIAVRIPCNTHKNKPRLHRRSQICPANVRSSSSSNKLTTRKHANRTQCSGTPPARTPYTWTLATLTMHVSGPKHPLHMYAHNAELLCKFQVTLRLEEKKNPSRAHGRGLFYVQPSICCLGDFRDAKPSLAKPILQPRRLAALIRQAARQPSARGTYQRVPAQALAASRYMPASF